MFAKSVSCVGTETDMICEEHPWLPWPHEECGGPGCPPYAAMDLMRQKVRALQSAVQDREFIIVSLYYALD